MKKVVIYRVKGRKRRGSLDRGKVVYKTGHKDRRSLSSFGQSKGRKQRVLNSGFFDPVL